MGELVTVEGVKVSSLGIAERTGTEHKHVMAKVRKSLEKQGIDLADEFSSTSPCVEISTYINRGKEYEYYILDEKQAFILAGSYDPIFLGKVFELINELKEQIKQPKELTIVDYAKALIESDAEKQVLEQQIDEGALRGEGAENMIDADGTSAKMEALRIVGLPYSDEEIANAKSEVEGKTEMDALIAYLQELGTALKTRR